jgi:hypothetical protein
LNVVLRTVNAAAAWETKCVFDIGVAVGAGELGVVDGSLDGAIPIELFGAITIGVSDGCGSDA